MHMSVLPTQSNTLTIAKESLAMSERTGDKTFQRMALGLMALTGIGTLLHAVHELYRDVQPRREKAKAAAQAQPAEAKGEPQPLAHDEIPSQSWVHKARVGERPAEGERLWSESLEHRGRGRHH